MNRPHEEIVGNSSALAEALEHVSRLAGINRPVLIIGERGTGKELAADRLHYLSARWDGPFIKVNCAAISDELLDSELFGHEAGAFTGATGSHKGRFERANGGTLFLDELATMSIRLQEKLLRLIEYGEFERLGGQETLHVDVRVIAATNANLRKLAIDGVFRNDLLDRLSFDVVHLPPLRYRAEDIPALAHHFAVQMCGEIQWEYFPGFSEFALSQLGKHNWPGNIRELKNTVERSLFRWGEPGQAVDKIILDPFDSPYEDILSQENSLLSAEELAPISSLNQGGFNSVSTGAAALNFTLQVQEFEQHILREALRVNQSHQGRTAKSLGLSYHQLRGLLKKYPLLASRNNE